MLTEERITERLNEDPSAAGAEVAPAGGTRDADFDYSQTTRHRPFDTHRPDGSVVEGEEEEEEDEGREEGKGGGIISKVLILLGAVVFLVVVLVCLVYFLGQQGGQTQQMQAGGLPDRPGAQRQLDDATQQAADARKAVTEAAQPSASPTGPSAAGGLQPAGDLSLPVTPDPLGASGYAPNAVAPPAGSAGTTSTPSGSTSGTAGGSPESTSGAGRATDRDSDVVGSGRGDLTSREGRAQPGSFYFFAGGSQQGLPLEPRAGGGVMRSNAPGGDAASQFIKPPFNSLLPVRLLDSVMTLRQGGVVRLETTRTTAGPGGWRIPRGTVVVARLAGGDTRRAYLNVVGLIDAGTNTLVNVGGEVKGTDGALGVAGERRRVNSLFKSILKEAGRSGYSLAQSLGSAYLLGRRGGTGYIPPPQIGVPGVDPTRANGSEVADYLYVRAGAQAYVLVTDLPATADARDAGGVVGSGELTDDELSRLISEGTTEEIRAALPRMNPELRRLAETILAQEPRQ